MGDPFNKDMWDGYLYRCSPNAPGGGGGTGMFGWADPYGAEPGYKPGTAHPFSYAALAQQQAPSKAPPAMLELIAGAIGQYSEDELNAALKTTFGEISAPIHNKLQEEANAVASTIFNRLASIVDARAEFTRAQQKVNPAKIAMDDAAKKYEDLTNHPAKYKAEFKDQYNKKVKDAYADYQGKKSAYGKTQTELNSANSKKIKAESYVKPSKRGKPNLTLADIVELNSQYEGTKKGKADFDNFSTMNNIEQQRNLKRWNTAKLAVVKMVKNPAIRDKYMEFRSNQGQANPPALGRIRIGGNDFW
jgi:hypothetical protein